MSATRVYLVGAGPGDPGLLTLRAKELLEQADVVVYDYLAADVALRFAPKQAELMFVGKKGFSAHVTQPEINDLLVNLAKDSRGTIVRLKGGDPFVFGRGGEEALALQEADVCFEIVPGVTAGVAAPAYAGIPVTHRGISSSVTLITGHETPEKDESAIDWTHLAQGADTLCFYMGIHDLPMICERLIAGGRPDTTPVALVRWGTTSKQETLVATLATVVEEAQRAHFEAPAIIVVGEVVALRDQLNWFENKPLLGKSVVVTRSRAQASVLSELLSSKGAEVVEFPTIDFKPCELDSLNRSRISRLASDAAGVRETYDWVVFTSVNGVKCFFNLLKQSHNDSRVFGDVRVAAIGPATAKELEKYGIRADVVPPRFIAEAVAEALLIWGVGPGVNVLIPRAMEARDTLPEILEQVGAKVDIMPVYETIIPEEPEQAKVLVERLREGSIDAVTFTSSSTVKNFVALIEKAAPGESAELVKGIKGLSIGPVTSKTMEELGVPLFAESETYTVPELANTVVEAFTSQGEA